MKPFEKRLAEQYFRMARHVKNLRAFADDHSRFKYISPEEQSLLLIQLEHMAQLEMILAKRMKLHNLSTEHENNQ